MTDNRSILERFMSFVKRDWQWIGSKNNKGYGEFRMNGKIRKAHRVSYELFNGPIPPNMCVLHSCDDPGCINPDHLHLGDIKLNNQEAIDRGRVRPLKGEMNGRAKLTEANIYEIKELINKGMIQSRIAEKFGVTRGMIYHIAHNRNWKHLSS